MARCVPFTPRFARPCTLLLDWSAVLAKRVRLVAGCAAALAVAAGCASPQGQDPPPRSAPTTIESAMPSPSMTAPPRPELPRGGRTLFPHYRLGGYAGRAGGAPPAPRPGRHRCPGPPRGGAAQAGPAVLRWPGDPAGLRADRHHRDELP